MLCNGDKASDQCPFLSSDRYRDIVLSQVGLKACQTRGRHSLNEWDYALPARPTGSCPILGQLVMWKARLCSTLKKVTFWECRLWPKEFKSRHAWNMCSFTDKVCNSER